MAWVTKTHLFSFMALQLNCCIFFCSGMKDEDILSFPFFSLHSSRLPSCAQGIMPVLNIKQYL